MLSYSEIKERKYILLSGTPFEVISSHVSRKQANKPQNKTKLRNLLSGGVIEHTFHVSDTVEEADISRKKIQFIYTRNNEVWFHKEGDPSSRFTISKDIVGEKAKYLKPNLITEVLVFVNDKDEEQIIGIQLPIKMDFEVVDAPPTIKGNTSSGGNKIVSLDNGLKISVPLFIEKGDVVKINTNTGEYVERISRA